MRTSIVKPGAALAALGASFGLMLAVWGLPYGQFDHGAFAELYHGDINAANTIHFAIDCEPLTPSSEEDCDYYLLGAAEPFEGVRVTVANSTDTAVTIGAFAFKLRTDETALTPVDVSDSAPHVNSNPDMNEESFGEGWGCTDPQPNADVNSDPAVADSSITCLNFAGAVELPPDMQHLALASVYYDITATSSTDVPMEIMEATIYDESFAELGSCNPVVTIPSPCFGATVGINFSEPPVPDTDTDGIADTADNCPTIANADQLNSDGNVVSNAPASQLIDNTRANSDGLGDVCDPDSDNDARPNAQETDILTCLLPALGPITNAVVYDTDGDRVGDGAECTLGTSPLLLTAKPTLAQCGAATDADNDGLSARLEYCSYGTLDTSADSDSDGVSDGCEAASVNPDTIVNVADLGLVAAETVRAVPALLKVANLDINKDGAYNPADLGMVAARFGKCR